MKKFLIDNATIIVAVIGAIVSVLTFVLGNVYKTKAELRKIKEEQYIGFLTNLVKTIKAKDDSKENVEEELSIKIQTIYLVGNVGMQRALSEYLKIFNMNNNDLNQDELYGKLIQAMKIDLYGRFFWILPKKFRSIDKIKLIMFKDNKK